MSAHISLLEILLYFMVSLFSGGYWKPRQVMLRDEAEIHLQLLYKCIFNPGFRRQTIQRLMVMWTCFHRNWAINLRIIDQSLLRSWQAHTQNVLSVTQTSFFPPQFHWHCSPTITLPRNTWQPASAARELLILFPFFEAIRSLCNRPLSFSRRFKWHDVIAPHFKNSSDLNFVLLTI